MWWPTPLPLAGRAPFVDPALLALLADPQWQPYVVFPGEFVAPERVVTN
jgi:DTW domain-containing protein YfiP